MNDPTDQDLLRQYARENSEAAFAELVSRHVNLVYSVALRKTGTPADAEEITQAVFILLARKAATIPASAILPGWLYQSARLIAAAFLKRECRRARREHEAHMQTEIHTATADETWGQLAPLLDDAMGQLGESERAAVVLRFHCGRSFAEVGAAAGVTENAAKKRVARALEKLHLYFSRRGVRSTLALIAGAISANSVQAAPASLANSVTAVALGKGASASLSTLTLIKGAIKIMAFTKLQITAVTVAAVVALAGTTTAVKMVQKKHRSLAWLRVHVWPAERKEMAAKVKARQQVDDTTGAVIIDLKPFINASLTDAPLCWKGNNANNLAELPAGTNIYAGVPFDAEGIIQLMGGWLKHYDKTYPASVQAIPIRRRCAKIHLLHGDGYVEEGTHFGMTVAKLILHYENGSTREMNMDVCKQVFDSWNMTCTT
jgi:RNA polymerase sigma factor (sigma-70 family)